MTPEMVSLLTKAVDVNDPFTSYTEASERLASFLSAQSQRKLGLLNSFGWPASELPALSRLLGVGSKLILELTVFASTPIVDWEAERENDANLMNSFIAESESQAEIRTYALAEPSHLHGQELFDRLRGFSSVNVQVCLTDYPTVSDSIALAADCDWISLCIDIANCSPKLAAQFIFECSGLETPYQLHGFSGALFTSETRFGVLNGLAAGVLAFTNDLSTREIEELLRADLRDSSLISARHSGFRDIEAAREVFWGVSTGNLESLVNELNQKGILA